jgi:hypothetical protein
MTKEKSARKASGPGTKQASGLQQFMILSARNLKILTRDRSGLILMLATAPLVSLLDVILSLAMGRNPLDFNTGDVAKTIITLFLFTIYGVMVGGISQMREIVKEQEIVDLYSMAHCYVQPSRGEGFGLQPLQAIAQGMPTILTDAHGQAEYAHLAFGIDAKEVPAAYFMLGEAGNWWEPDFDQLCDQMKYVYENYGRACDHAIASSIAAHGAWTWAHAAQDWIDLHDGLLELPYSGSGVWHEPAKHKYMIKTLRLWTPEIGGTKYVFEPYEEYWVPADVKRLAYEHQDLLHPDAIESEAGLSESQIATLGTRRAEEAYCPSCGQQINSGKTRADVIYDELQRERAGAMERGPIGNFEGLRFTDKEPRPIFRAEP